jgi:NAD(P)-dependent dehydrogenase (short-subunit alcohol dehydrogenase family)
MVACAGISGGGWTINYPLDQARRILDVNVLGTLACCQAAGRVFQSQDQPGSVVLIASMSGHGSNKVCRSPCVYSLKAREWGRIPLLPHRHPPKVGHGVQGDVHQ